MSLVFLFLDGVGLGEDNGQNPFALNDYPAFKAMTGGRSFTGDAGNHQRGSHYFTSLDACLGVDGLPQSGTGQVTLFTGINSAKVLGRHFGPYPHSAIRSLLGEESIFKKIGSQNGRCHFINAFPQRFIDYVTSTNRWSSTTFMTASAGMKLNSVAEILEEKAITAELTQHAWRTRLSLEVPLISEEDAAGRVIRASKEHDLVLVEYYLTDKAGHSRDGKLAHSILTRIDRFLQHLIRLQAEHGYTLILTSDHGNLEDLSTKTHTRNRVPLFVLGEGAHHFHGAESIQDITPRCVEWHRSALGKR